MIVVLLYWGCMIACYYVASRLRNKKEKFNWLGTATNIIIYLVCLIMGLRMGSNEEVTSSLGTIGIQSVIVSAMCIFGSVFFVFLTRKLLRLDKDGAPEDEIKTAHEECGEIKEEKSLNSFGFTAIILLVVILGMLGGYYLIPVTIGYNSFEAMSSTWLTVGICILLGLIGFSMGLSGALFEQFRSVGAKVVFFPVAAVSGSMVFGAIYGLVSPMTVREGLAISVGFGWYTFAPGVIIDAGHAVAGAISFMHNVIRETLGIIIIPLAAEKIGAIEATAIPGVAAMDVCLPIVERSARRPDIIVYSFANGFLMALCTATLVAVFIG